MRTDAIPVLDTAAVVAAATARMRAVAPEHDASLRSLLDRLDPARWTLEWHLPWWLGHAFGLDRDVAFDLVVSDVLGLASIRLQDDLVDGQVTAEDAAASRSLSVALFEAALEPYRARFDPDHELWVRVDAWMGEWRVAAGVAGQVTGLDRDPPDADADAHDSEQATRRLAARATPIRIPAFAVCALAGHEEDFAVLDRCLDHALAALVLYDHLVDRDDDLDAGRWNALVASVSPLPQTPEHRERNRAAMAVALMASGAADVLCARIEEEMERAAILSDTLDCPPLSAYLRDSGARARRQGREVDAHYRGVAERATQLLFPGLEGISTPPATGRRVAAPRR